MKFNIKIKFLLPIVIVLLTGSLFFFAYTIFAEDFFTLQLTFTSSSKVITDMDRGRFIWEENKDNGRQIMLHDGSSIRQLTFDEYPIRNVDSKIDGDYVVWIKEDGSNNTYTPQIYTYRISTNELIQITNDNQYVKHEPDIANGKIVWSFRPKDCSVSCDYDIMMFDLNTDEFTQITNDIAPSLIDDRVPAISENLIAWRRGNSQDDVEIYIRDLVSSLVTRLTDNSFHENRPQVSGNYIGWYGYDGNDFEIYLYDGNQVRQITDDTTISTRFSLFGDKLAYEYNDGITNRIGLYTISNQTNEYIADGESPRTDGNKIIWFKSFYKPEINLSSMEIFIKDLATGEISQVTTDAFVKERNGFVSGGKVAWVGELRPEGWSNVFMAFVFSGDTPPGSNVVVTENNITLTFSQVDIGGETTVTTSSSGTQPPTGFKLGNPPTYYSISTTAAFSGTVEVCINYDETTIQGNENKLKLMHYDPILGWVDVTSSLDTINNIICGLTTSFSDFAVMTEPTIQDLIDRVKQMNLQQGIENSLDSKLQRVQDAQDAVSNNNQTEMINVLQAFINEVEAQRGNKLTNDQSNELSVFASNIIKIII